MNHGLTKATKLKLLIPVLYAVISLIFIAMTWNDDHIIFEIVGSILTAFSFVCWIISRIQLGNAFTIAPYSKFIVKTGFYSKLRHPVYYFSILTVCGIGIYIFQPFVLIPICLLLLLQLFRIKKEEALLIQSFGDEYLDYKKATWI